MPRKSQGKPKRKRSRKPPPNNSEPRREQNLTYRQQLFVSFYLGEAAGNATEAARMAGYAVPAQQGAENLIKPVIRAAIDARVDAVALSADELLARQSEVARADMGDFIKFDKRGRLSLDLKTAFTEGRTHLIKKLTKTQFGYVVELHDSQAAQERLCRYHGMFRDRVIIEPPGGHGKTRAILEKLAREAEPEASAGDS